MTTLDITNIEYHSAGYYHPDATVCNAKQAEALWNRLQALEQELERVRKDARRYEWMRSEEVCTNPRYYEFWNRFLEAKLVREEVMDNLIDEYMELDTARRTSGDGRG